MGHLVLRTLLKAVWGDQRNSAAVMGGADGARGDAKLSKKDLAKLFFNDGKILRFSAKFSGEVAEEDTMRRFLITYYLFDDLGIRKAS